MTEVCGVILKSLNAAPSGKFVAAAPDLATPRTDHVIQHGLPYTGKDELLYLCKTLERELNAYRAGKPTS